MEGKGAQAAESGSIPHTRLCSTICLLAKVPMDINICDLEETVIKILHIVKGSVGHVVQKEEHRVQCMGLLFWGWFHDYINYPVDFFCYSTLIKWVAQKYNYHTPRATWSGRNNLPKAII